MSHVLYIAVLREGFCVISLSIVFDTQQAQYVGPMLVQCWANVVDGGPTLVRQSANILCRQGIGE